MLNCLTTELNSITPNSTILKECKDVLLRELKRRYGMIELNDHAAIATILDPKSAFPRPLGWKHHKE